MSLNKDEIDTLHDLISRASNEDLDGIISVFKARRRMLTLMEARSFKLGAKVKWQSKDGATHRGTVAKINRGTVAVKSRDGKAWRVSPMLLEVAT